MNIGEGYICKVNQIGHLPGLKLVRRKSNRSECIVGGLFHLWLEQPGSLPNTQNLDLEVDRHICCSSLALDDVVAALVI